MKSQWTLSSRLSSWVLPPEIQHCYIRVHPFSCLHTGDLRLSLLLLKATFLQVGQGAGIPPSEHREAADASCSRRELLWRDGAADCAAHGATGHVAVDRQGLETGRENPKTGVRSSSDRDCEDSSKESGAVLTFQLSEQTLYCYTMKTVLHEAPVLPGSPVMAVNITLQLIAFWFDY